MLPGYYKVVSRVFQGCFRCSKGVSMVLCGCFKGVSRVVQWSFKGVLKVLQGYCIFVKVKICYLIPTCLDLQILARKLLHVATIVRLAIFSV